MPRRSYSIGPGAGPGHADRDVVAADRPDVVEAEAVVPEVGAELEGLGYHPGREDRAG